LLEGGMGGQAFAGDVRGVRREVQEQFAKETGTPVGGGLGETRTREEISDEQSSQWRRGGGRKEQTQECSNEKNR